MQQLPTSLFRVSKRRIKDSCYFPENVNLTDEISVKSPNQCHLVGSR